MKLTTDQRKLLDETVLAIVRDATQALRFGEVDSRTRRQIVDRLEGDWSFRFTDGALQRLRKAGLLKTAHQRWSAVPQKDPPP